jgi:hypothetical protein
MFAMLAVAACQCAGQTAKAADWLAVLSDLRPDSHGSHFFNTLPIADPAFRATVLAALTRAGIPQ